MSLYDCIIINKLIFQFKVHERNKTLLTHSLIILNFNGAYADKGELYFGSLSNSIIQFNSKYSGSCNNLENAQWACNLQK